MAVLPAILIALVVPAQGLEGGLRAAHHRLHSKSVTLSSDKHGTNHTDQGVSDASLMGSATIPDAAAQQKIVEAHNFFRCSMCDTPPMTWDDAIAKDAMRYMNTMPSDHCPSYDGKIPGCVGHGENLFQLAAGDDSAMWQRAVNAWFASEIDCYDFDTGSSKCTSGHFTQVAWDTSIQVGCASIAHTTGAWGTLCMYGKPANIIGQYTKHIHKCPAAKQFQYFTGKADCCNGPKTNCKVYQGKTHCGWEYEYKSTTTGCPAGSCSIHAGCATVPSTTIAPVTTPAPATTTALTRTATMARTLPISRAFYLKASDRSTVIHASGGTAIWNRLTMNICPGYPNCQWQLEASPTRHGMFYIKASDRNTYIHAEDGTNSGNPLAMYTCAKEKDYPNCQWQLEASPTRPGMYYIKASNKESYIHAYGGTALGNRLVMYTCPKHYDYPNCQWYIPPSVVMSMGR